MILDNSTPFIHLRNHTAYSIAEGALSISSIVEFCKKYEMPAVAITDTNNIFGGVKFSTTMVDKGIQPIFGTQLSVDFNLPTSIFDKKELSELVLLVKNDVGYRNLIKLLSIAYTQKLDTDPPGISESVLYENTEGLIVLSGGVNGVIGKCLLAEQEELAENFCLKLNKVFHDNFYMEIQRHGSFKEANTESKFLDFAMKYNIPVVATNECFFINKDMYTAHEALLCIKNGTYYDDTTREKKTVEHYFKSKEEMKSLFFDLPEAIINTSVIASRCSYIFKKVSPLLPHVEKGIDEISLLKEKSITGLEERLLSIGVTDNKEKKIYFDRLEYELEIIIKMKFPGYFLIVSDFIRWAKNQEIPVGPGRGSGAGSVVAWALKITDINPLRFGLLFERFLNPERQSMPDFDIDFCADRR